MVELDARVDHVLFAKGCEMVGPEFVLVVLDELIAGSVALGLAVDSGNGSAVHDGFSEGRIPSAMTRQDLGEGEFAPLRNTRVHLGRHREVGRVLSPGVRHVGSTLKSVFGTVTLRRFASCRVPGYRRSGGSTFPGGLTEYSRGEPYQVGDHRKADKPGCQLHGGPVSSLALHLDLSCGSFQRSSLITGKRRISRALGEKPP